jgi:hypothetical protein
VEDDKIMWDVETDPDYQAELDWDRAGRLATC